MMEVVIVDDGNRLTVYELVERVIPCIIAKHYSENYIQGFRSTFRNLLAYCNKNEKKYFTAELAQQFMLDCYGVQPGTVERDAHEFTVQWICCQTTNTSTRLCFGGG